MDFSSIPTGFQNQSNITLLLVFYSYIVTGFLKHTTIQIFMRNKENKK
jgi:hypothetical protein